MKKLINYIAIISIAISCSEAKFVSPEIEMMTILNNGI